MQWEIIHLLTMSSCFFSGFVLLIIMSTASGSKLFKKFSHQPLVADQNKAISTHKISPKECSLSADIKHLGFIYNHTDNTCHLLTCANPGVHTGSLSSHVDIYYGQPMTANRLLARGQCTCFDCTLFYNIWVLSQMLTQVMTVVCSYGLFLISLLLLPSHDT